MTETENLYTYRIEANAFLKHMVRAIVGTLVAWAAASYRRGDGGEPRQPATAAGRRDRSAAGSGAGEGVLRLTSLCGRGLTHPFADRRLGAAVSRS